MLLTPLRIDKEAYLVYPAHINTRYSTPGLVLGSRCIAVGEMGRKMACDSWKYISFFGHSGKIGRYAGIVGLKLCTNPGTLSSSLRYDSRWDFEEKSRGLCAFLPCLLGV